MYTVIIFTHTNTNSHTYIMFNYGFYGKMYCIIHIFSVYRNYMYIGIIYIYIKNKIKYELSPYIHFRPNYDFYGKNTCIILNVYISYIIKMFN